MDLVARKCKCMQQHSKSFFGHRVTEADVCQRIRFFGIVSRKLTWNSVHQPLHVIVKPAVDWQSFTG